MSPYSTACFVSILNQQQQLNIYNHNQKANELDNDTTASCYPTERKYCTVVEGGRVVVKPISPVPQQPGLDTP